jgi:hypothetical protein
MGTVFGHYMCHRTWRATTTGASVHKTNAPFSLSARAWGNKNPPSRCFLERGSADIIGHGWHAIRTPRALTALPPHKLSFSTVRRRCLLQVISRFGSRLNPASPVLTVGVSRRFRSAACCHTDASPNKRAFSSRIGMISRATWSPSRPTCGVFLYHTSCRQNSQEAGRISPIRPSHGGRREHWCMGRHHDRRDRLAGPPGG